MPIDPNVGITPAASSALGEEADVALVAEVNQKATPFIELGATGLKRSGGYIDEEFLPQLRGRKAVQVYREMSENSPIVGGAMFAVNQLIGNTDWRVVPAGKSKDHANAAKLVETAKDDMSHSWADMIQEALSELIFGWSWHEIVYKRRMGPWQKDGRHRSKYSDGLIGWRKMPIRSQETLLRWIFDEDGGVRGMVQMAPPRYETRILPIERSLLFRYRSRKGNPEGVSLLRTAYRPYYYLKRIEESESIGIERDLAGLPMVTVPAEYLTAPPGSPQHKMVQAMQKMVRSVRRDEQEGIVFPAAYDAETKQPKYKFELLTSGGARQHNTDAIIQRYEMRILMSILADWIMVGHESTGTYSLHVDKTGVFRAAMNSIAGGIADVINRHAIPRLFSVNGWKPAELPRIEPNDVDAPDLAQLAQFLTATAGLGFNWGPDADLEKFLRQTARMPELQPDEYEAHKKVARQEEAIRFADVQTRFMAARSSLALAAVDEAQGMPVGTAEQGAQAGATAAATAPIEDAKAENDHQRATEQKVAVERAKPKPKATSGGSSGSRKPARK